jgi:hypothetical protein
MIKDIKVDSIPVNYEFHMMSCNNYIVEPLDRLPSIIYYVSFLKSKSDLIISFAIIPDDAEDQWNSHTEWTYETYLTEIIKLANDDDEIYYELYRGIEDTLNFRTNDVTTIDECFNKALSKLNDLLISV